MYVSLNNSLDIQLVNEYIMYIFQLAHIFVCESSFISSDNGKCPFQQLTRLTLIMVKINYGIHYEN